MTNRRTFLASMAVLAGCGGGGEDEAEGGILQDVEVPGRAEQSAAIVSALQQLCGSARHAIVWGDAALHEGRFAPNRATSVMPTRNVLAFSTGPLVNESGSALPTRTNNHTTWSDAGGKSYATRLQSTGNQTFYFYRTSMCPRIPIGRYGFRFRCRAMPGTGAHNILYGLSTRYTAGVAVDLDWRVAANAKWTTFSVELQYGGSGDIGIRLPLPGIDILVDRVQLYFGGLEAVPSWEQEVAGLQGGRKGFAFPGAIAMSPQGHWKQAVRSGGGWILEPGLADYLYQRGVTIMHACALDDLNSALGLTIAYGLATRADPRLGTTLNTLHAGFETNIKPYEGQVKFAPSTAARAQLSCQALGHNIVILGQAGDAAGRRMFLNAIPVLTEAKPLAPFTANSWHVGSGSPAARMRAHVADFELVGRHAVTLIWDRALTNEEWAQAALVVQEYLADKGAAAFADFHVFSGDSNWTKASGDVLQLLASHGAFNPAPNLWGRVTACGGTGVAEVYGLQPYPAPMDPAGRLLAVEVPMMQAALRAGRKVVYHLQWGTNDFNEIHGVPAWGVMAYVQTRQAIVDYLLALHPNVWVLEYTIMAAGSGSGRDYRADTRETVNAQRRARVAMNTTPRHRLCDIGGSGCGLGSQTLADTSTYLIEPAPGGIHLNRSGDAIAAAYLKPQIAALRMAMSA